MRTKRHFGAAAQAMSERLDGLRQGLVFENKHIAEWCGVEPGAVAVYLRRHAKRLGIKKLYRGVWKKSK